MRFIAMTIFGAIAMAISGLALLYLSYHAWRTGEFHLRRSVLDVSDSPVQFYFVTGMGAVFGALLLLAVPSWLRATFSSPSEREKIESNHPKLYGKTRPGLFITLLILVGLVAVTFVARI